MTTETTDVLTCGHGAPITARRWIGPGGVRVFCEECQGVRLIVVLDEKEGPDTELSNAIAEVGRILESMPPHERKPKVARIVEEMDDNYKEDFVTGVFIWAHEVRIFLSEGPG